MKRKILLITLVFVLALAACQGGGPVAEQPVATQEILATDPDVEIEQPIATEEPEPEPEVPVEPEDVEVEVIPEDKPTATQAAAVPTATQAAAPSGPQPTPVSGDPAAILGEPDGVDTFDSGGHWPQSTNACFSAEVKDGKYYMTALGEANMFCWEVTWPLLQNFYIEVTTQPVACSAGDIFGLFFRAPDNSKGYMYGISCDGRYVMAMWDGSKTTVLAELTANESIQSGQGAVNRIGVLASGSTYDLYSNGVYLERVEDSSFTGEGKIGFFVRPGTSQGFITTFDDLKIWLSEGDAGSTGQTEGSGAPTPEPVPIETPASGIPTVTANTNVNVRSGPGTNYPVLGALLQGQTAEIAGKSPDSAWWAIKIPTTYAADGIGWVSAAYVTASNVDNVIPIIQPPEPPPDVSPSPPEGGSTIMISTEPLNVRAGPGNEFPSYGKIPANIPLQVVELSPDGRWTAVSIPTAIAPDGIGWVNSSYLVPVE